MLNINVNRLMIQPTTASVLSVCDHACNSVYYEKDAVLAVSFFAFFLHSFYRFYNSARFYLFGYFGYYGLFKRPCKHNSRSSLIGYQV